MKKWLVLSQLLLSATLYAQKPVLDSTAYSKWQSLIAPSISNDGKYCSYIRRGVEGNTMIIQATLGTWNMEINTGMICSFTDDSRQAIVLKAHDSLLIINLGSSEIKCIPTVRSYQYAHAGVNDWLACQLNNSNNDFILYNLISDIRQVLSGVKNFIFNEKGTVIILQCSLEHDSATALSWLDLGANKMDTIWTGKNADNLTFGTTGGLLAFMGTTSSENPVQSSIYMYNRENKSINTLLEGSETSKQSGLFPANIIAFNKDANKLFITLKNPIPKANPTPHPVDVDIYSYLDPKLQSQQLRAKEYQRPPVYHFVIDVPTHKLVRLEEEGEEIFSPLNPQFISSYLQNIVLVRKSGGGDIFNEWHWNSSSRFSVSIVSTETGEHKRLFENKPFIFTINCSLSPEGNYVVHYDPDKKNYYSYSISTGLNTNITKGIQTEWTSYDDDLIRSYFSTMGLAGWSKHDSSLLIYDRHDIWKLDPKGESPPFNLTNAYGKLHNIIFHLALRHDDRIINLNEELLASAFNRINKHNGFYLIDPRKRENPKLLTMQPYVLEGTEYDLTDFSPIKARDTNVYIIRRERAEEFPNLYITLDFSNLRPLTSIHPEQSYNWLRTELHTWTLPNGSTNQGILYKPENFDPKKKYPIIFYYYEKMSGGLHTYLYPGYSDGVLNIPQYVSNGYLVFTPDIHYTVGHPGTSVVNTVTSAAQYLSTLPYVDTKHMGIQGHSRGGWETNFLVTHTHLFAAAMSASGLTDYVSLYGRIRSLGDGTAGAGAFELGFQRIGAPLWTRPDLYIENSPVFKANLVTTPLLMMANEKDKDVPFEQGIEFFTALRSLGKKVWLLQYDGSGHVLKLPSTEKDLTIRMQQFFDHYLKNAPAPKWMIESIPAARKGIDLGYELVSPGIEPGVGPYSPIPIHLYPVRK